MGDIDEISNALGKVQAALEYQNKIIDRMSDNITVVKNTTDGLSRENVSHKMIMDALHDRVDIIQPIVEKHQTLVEKGKGIFWVLSGAMGVIGFVLSQFVFPWLTRLIP